GVREITIDEIGEINDHIQIEAGHGANIIMGVGEDEELGEAIAVTVIATGFNVDQQDHIVNTESKKVFYTLEEEQTAQQELSPEATAVQEIKVQGASVVRPEPKTDQITHTLELEGGEEDQLPRAEAGHSDLIPTTKDIRNFNVFD